MRRLQVDAFYQGDVSKQAAMEDIHRRFGVDWREMAYVGDDRVDLVPMGMVGLPVAVANAREEVKARALYVTKAPGGEGAVREVVEWLLACRGQPDIPAPLRAPGAPDPKPASAPGGAPPGTKAMKGFLFLAGIMLIGCLLGLCWRNAWASVPGGEEDALLDAATLAIKGISLIQGEGGFEYWRLKANWAGMSEKDGDIDVREPVVRYNLGEKGNEDFVHVVAELGRISDNQRVLTLWRNVVLTHDDAVMTGPVLIYQADTRHVFFPEGADLENGKMTGTFTTLRWNMRTRVIEGEQGIDIVFKAPPPRSGGEE
jgi:hypothetical protein